MPNFLDLTRFLGAQMSRCARGLPGSVRVFFPGPFWIKLSRIFLSAILLISQAEVEDPIDLLYKQEFHFGSCRLRYLFHILLVLFW